jgi:hypothetical protein
MHSCIHAFRLVEQKSVSEKKREEFTPGPYPDLKEDRTRIGLDDRVLCFHG